MKTISAIALVLSILACGTAYKAPLAAGTPQARTAPLVDVIETAPTASNQAWIVCRAEYLNARGCPSTTCSVRRVLKGGTPVNVREWSHNGNGWAMIAVAEWVNGDYLCRR